MNYIYLWNKKNKCIATSDFNIVSSKSVLNDIGFISWQPGLPGLIRLNFGNRLASNPV